MAVNQSRSMSGEFRQGSADSTYISLIPNQGGDIGHIPSERLAWPQYGQAQQHVTYPFCCDDSAHLGKGIEYLR
jgi:hypothetical protein